MPKPTLKGPQKTVTQSAGLKRLIESVMLLDHIHITKLFYITKNAA